MYNQQSITPTFDSSTVVLAEKVQQMQSVRRRYLKIYKTALIKEKNEVLKELKQVEDEVETIVYEVLHKPQMSVNAKRGGAVLTN